MRRAKSIDQLYEEVKGYDLVITNDAALVTALNGRIDVPRIGGFAYTPRHIASKESVPLFGKETLSDLSIISWIAEETGYSFKHIHSELENIRTIRRYKKDVRKYLYSNSSKEIYGSFLGLHTDEKLMDSYEPKNREFFIGKKVAVIGIDFFDDLDKHFIPKDHDEIDIFNEGRYDIETIYEVGNDRQIAENIVSLIENVRAEDVAIVLDTTGPIADAVRAALYQKKIDFKNTMSVKDLSQVRDYLQFLTLSLSYETLRVRHVRELFSGYGGTFDQKEDEYLLNKIEGHLRKRTKELAGVMRNVRSMTFTEVCDIVVKESHRPQIRILLDEMHLIDTKVTSRLVNELSYAVNNIDDLHHNEEIPPNEKKGVLLADCLRSLYVDRPFVIFLGLGPEWSAVSIGKEYIDRETEAELNMLRFSVLLQQGSSKVYAVNSMRNGKEATPCPIFEQIKEQERSPDDKPEILGFRNVCRKPEKGLWVRPEPKERIRIEEDRPDPQERVELFFSKSTYKHYYTCPRAFMFGKIITIPDSEDSIFGTIMHHFAEFYLCYPDLVEGKIDKFTEMIRENYSGLSNQQMKDLDSSKIRVCMTNLKRFIDSLSIENVPLDMKNSDRKHKNMFMEMHDCELYSSLAEARLSSKIHHLAGNADLAVKNLIIDYKTGKASTPKQVMEGMNMNKKPRYFEFQPIMYLSMQKESYPPPCTFTLFYAAENDVRSITDENFVIKENIREAELLPITMREYLSGTDSPVKNGLTKDYAKIRENWNSFADMAFGAGMERCETWKDDERLISSLLGILGLSSAESNRKKVVTVLKRLADVIKDGMVIADEKVIITSDTVEKFLSIVDEHNELASKQMYSDFPARPRLNCERCDFYKACTSEIVELEGGDQIDDGS